MEKGDYIVCIPKRHTHKKFIVNNVGICMGFSNENVLVRYESIDKIFDRFDLTPEPHQYIIIDNFTDMFTVDDIKFFSKNKKDAEAFINGLKFDL